MYIAFLISVGPRLIRALDARNPGVPQHVIEGAVLQHQDDNVLDQLLWFRLAIYALWAVKGFLTGHGGPHKCAQPENVGRYIEAMTMRGIISEFMTNAINSSL